MFCIYIVIGFISFLVFANRCEVHEYQIWVCTLTLIVLSAIWPLTWLAIIVFGIQMVLERRGDK